MSLWEDDEPLGESGTLCKLSICIKYLDENNKNAFQ